MTDPILPVPDETSAPYWKACAEHVLTLPRCSDCGAFAFPPDITCPACGSLDPRYGWQAVSGDGRIRTWTVVRHSFLQGFELPFMLVDVQLDAPAGIRLIGRLVDGPDAQVALGDRVRVTFDDLSSEFAVPAFALESGA